MDNILPVLIPSLVAGVFSVIICIIEVRGARDRKRTDARAQTRAKESRLSMKLANATAKLGVVTAKAVTHQHVNGDVEDAIRAAQQAQEEYQAFVEEIASTHVTKN